MPFGINFSNPFRKAAPATQPVEQEKPVEKPVTSTDTSTETAPVSTPAVEVAGTVQSVERNFEWNVGRLFKHEEGHSKARTWAVRVLSVALVLPLVLTVIVDLGRGLGFMIGNKSATVGKYFDGKSFSLIDKVSTGVKTISDKVRVAYKNFMHPEYTVEQLNQFSEKAMKAHVAKLVDGYRSLNGGRIHSNDSFSTPTALAAENQIVQAQKDLIAVANEMIARNATQVEGFESYTQSVNDKIDAMIREAAGDDRFVANKTVREGTPELMSEVAIRELDKACEANQPVVAQQFVEVAKQDEDFVAALGSGIEQEVLTEAQAKQALIAQAPVVFSESLESGLDAAVKAEKEFVESAVEAEIITQEEGAQIASKAAVVQLAAAAAKDVQKSRTPAEKPEAVQAKIVKAADQLIRDKKLASTDKSVFMTEVQKNLQAAAAAAEADRIALDTARQQAEVEAQQQTQAIEAERLAQVKKAEDQSNLFGKFNDLLTILTKKQVSLTEQIELRDKLNVEREKLTKDHDNIVNTTVMVKGNQETLLKAEQLYQAELNKISAKKNLTDAERSAQINALVSSGDFSEQIIELMTKLKELTPELQAKTKEVSDAAEKVENINVELQTLVQVYRVFSASHKAELETDKRNQVVVLEKGVFDAQEKLNQRINDLFKHGIMARLRPQVAVVNTTRDGNEAEVNALIAEHNTASAPEAEETVPLAPATAPFAYGLRNWVWNHGGGRLARAAHLA